MSNDPAAFRNALGNFATGVAIVTTLCSKGTKQGVTANSFNSVSLDPPLVLVSLARTLTCFAHFESRSAFAVNLLRADQKELSRRFAMRGADKWQGVSHRMGALGVPILEHRLAIFECRPHARYDGGNHAILVGRVECFAIGAKHPPLIYFRGGYREIA